MSQPAQQTKNQKKIRILIADDIPETRENLRKLLFFESDVEVVGAASVKFLRFGPRRRDLHARHLCQVHVCPIFQRSRAGVSALRHLLPPECPAEGLPIEYVRGPRR